MCVHYITKLHTETNTVKNVKGAKLVGKHSYSPSVAQWTARQSHNLKGVSSILTGGRHLFLHKGKEEPQRAT